MNRSAREKPEEVGTLPIQHVVLLRFAEPLSATDRDYFISKLSEMPGVVDGFLRLRLGPDLNEGERARGYQLLMLSEHTDVSALRRYQEHPRHVALSEWVRARGGEALAFDYQLTGETVLFDGNG